MNHIVFQWIGMACMALVLGTSWFIKAECGVIEEAWLLGQMVCIFCTVVIMDMHVNCFLLLIMAPVAAASGVADARMFSIRMLLMIGTSLLVGTMLHLHSWNHLSLKSSEDAGEALCTLLDAEYDAVVEIDDTLSITHASKAFFGIVSLRPPTNAASTSNMLLRIMGTPGNAPSDVFELPEEAVEAGSCDSRKVVGQRFPSMFAHADDEVSLLKCLEEQRRAKEP